MKRLVIISLILLGVNAILNAQDLNMDLLEKFEEANTVECIIVMQDQLDMYGRTNGLTKDEKANLVYNRLKEHASKSQRSIVKYLSDNDIEFQAYHIFNGLKATLTLDQAIALTDMSEVHKVVYNSPIKVASAQRADINYDREDATWGITQIKADTVWEMGYFGEGVIIAGQDTGYDYLNPAILTKYRGYSEDTIVHDYHWHDAIHELSPLNNDTINDPLLNPCGLDVRFPCDDDRHGSHTMGTMVGGNDTLKIGVAPEASWIACRSMERGWGSPATYTECFEWFLAPTDLDGNNPDPTLAPHVINNSWGCPEIEGCNLDNFDMMETVINNLTAAGTVVVVSAGNDGNQGCSSIENPASIFENSFSVGASNKQDNKAGFSSIGPVIVDGSGRIKPDIVAPGVDVRSINNTGGFNNFNGTSMAGPHVAGTVALIINANPQLAGEVDIIKDIIRSTALVRTDSTECGDLSALDVPNFYYGHGRINALAAVESALTYILDTDNIDYDQYVSVFPNPNQGAFTIKSDINFESKIEIYNIAGSLVRVVQPTSNRTRVDGLSNGIYIYKASVKNTLVTGKIIVTE